MKLQLKADLALLMITFFWGASILLTKIGLNQIQEYNLIALRFLIAFFVNGQICIYISFDFVSRLYLCYVWHKVHIRFECRIPNESDCHIYPRTGICIF
jgi:drug/metabolite transporter (DMT)-like permease